MAHTDSDHHTSEERANPDDGEDEFVGPGPEEGLEKNSSADEAFSPD